ncbi:MAG: helix-turn-helix domain-containing protein [Ilumatobacteraceae bacterium]|nr:helix-turn-helix domain-containing protein [Ilumatobacteraceae bacterium]
MRAAELGVFLRSRRTRPALDQPGDGRRTRGLRREELAAASDVAHSWIVKLEQGRARSVSVDVLAALSRALQLDAAERSHLFALAGYRTGPSSPDSVVTAGLRRLLYELEPNPAYLLDRMWNMVDWNRAEETLFPPLADRRGRFPNLLELAFLDAELEALMIDSDEERERLVAQFRAHTVDWPDDPDIAVVVDRLRFEAPLFRQLWDRGDVREFHSVRRCFEHSSWEVLDHHRLAVLDQPGLQLVVYTPIDDGSE